MGFAHTPFSENYLLFFLLFWTPSMVPGTEWELEEYFLKEGREGNASETSISVLQTCYGNDDSDRHANNQHLLRHTMAQALC